MKKLFLLAIIMTSVHASHCYKKLCKGDFVIDQYGWTGQVTGFQPETGKVSVFLDYNPVNYLFPYEDLGLYQNCFDNYCVGEKVIDPYGDLVKIFALYDNGIARVFDENRDYDYHYKTSDLRRPSLK